MKEHFVLTIKSEDRPGLLHLITGLLNRKLIPIISLNAAPTDIHDIMLITVEIAISEKALNPLLLKLENIIEVFAVEAIPANRVICQRVAFFHLDKTIFASPQAIAIGKYDTQVINIYSNAIVIAKSGSVMAIRQLYNALEGPYLLGFSQTGLVADTKLLVHADEERIIRLAA
jgi:acetolactate synthase-1/3 small subunit